MRKRASRSSNAIRAKTEGLFDTDNETGPYWKSEEVDVRDIQVDEYQRDLRQAPLRRIINRIKANGWNQLVAGVLWISRREDGSYFVIDGQHRITAIIELEGRAPYIQQAVVWYGLTREQEAMMFSRTQSSDARTAIIPADIHRANLYMDEGGKENQQARRIEDCLQGHGYHISKGSGAGHSTALKAVSAAYEIESKYGLKILDKTFEVITLAWGNSSSPDSSLIKGMGMFVAMFPNANYNGLAKRLKKTKIGEWVTDAHRAGDLTKVKGRPTQVAHQLYREYNSVFHRNPLPSIEDMIRDHINDLRTSRAKEARRKINGGE